MNHGSSAPRSEFTVRLKFRPVDSSFYDLFAEAANHLVVGAQLLSEMLSAGNSKAEIAQRMREAEHAADETTHSIIRRVNSTFVTPFDREDIYSLASALDDVMDMMDEAVDLVLLYEVTSLPPETTQQVEVLQRCAELTAAAMPQLSSNRSTGSTWPRSTTRATASVRDGRGRGRRHGPSHRSLQPERRSTREQGRLGLLAHVLGMQVNNLLEVGEWIGPTRQRPRCFV